MLFITYTNIRIGSKTAKICRIASNFITRRLAEEKSKQRQYNHIVYNDRELHGFTPMLTYKYLMDREEFYTEVNTLFDDLKGQKIYASTMGKC
jgi:hypothetical protein